MLATLCRPLRLADAARLASLILMIAASSAVAQTSRLTIAGWPTAPDIRAEAAATDKVALLHGLAVIESNVHLAILFAAERLQDPTGSHAVDPRDTVWPEIRDGVLAAGGPDLGPLVETFAEAADEKSVRAAGTEVLKAVVLARGKLAPTDAELGASVLELVRGAAAKINATGPTELASYQDAWAQLGVARSEADLLLRSKDPALAKAATRIVLALDDVILFMPDPAARGPVAFEAAVIGDAADAIEALLAGQI